MIRKSGHDTRSQIKKISKTKLLLCFLQYPDWKFFNAKDPEETHSCYGDYIMGIANTINIIKQFQLVTFNSESFKNYLDLNGISLEKLSCSELSKQRANWVVFDSKKLDPKKAPSPFVDSPSATISTYGDMKNQVVSYIMVAIHNDNQVKDHYQFKNEDFDYNLEYALETMFLYTAGFGVKKINFVDSVLEPEICSCCGKPTFRISNMDGGTCGDRKPD